MPSNKKLLQAAAGNAGSTLGYVEDVFSTYLYEGTGAAHTITNGIDLDGEGGLTWIKTRNTGSSAWHSLSDTERGAGYILRSDLTNAQFFDTAEFTSFNSDGFTVGNDAQTNGSGRTYASWSFRKAEKFFDVVTYTGTGSTTTVSHNLGSTPGFIIVKRTSLAEDWTCYHVGVPGVANYIQLNKSDAYASNNSVFNNTAPTDSVFTVGSSDRTNTLGETYVAYLFASDAGGFGDDGTENIIKCGSVITDGSGNASVDVGFEPQWCLWKCADAAGGNEHGNWRINDTMRGWPVSDASNPFGFPSTLYANTSGAETISGVDGFIESATGFGFGQVQANKTYIYIAIRRPIKTPEAGTEVFAVDEANSGTNPNFYSGFPVDVSIRKFLTNSTQSPELETRLTNKKLETAQTAAEGATDSGWWDWQDGVSSSGHGTGTFAWMFKRATGFFDVVAYAGNATVRTVPHNLGVVPELMIVKKRNAVKNWYVYSAADSTKYLYLNGTNAFVSGSAEQIFGNDSTTVAPTSSVFSLGSQAAVNGSGDTFINYLFATLAGVSKVGSYTGTGADLNVDCGFSAGARFILIKRTDSTGDWYYWDSVRGIVAGNDPYLLLNSTAAEVTNTDYVDPLNAGFTVTSSASSTVNVSSGSYIFLAIA